MREINDTEQKIRMDVCNILVILSRRTCTEQKKMKAASILREIVEDLDREEKPETARSERP